MRIRGTTVSRFVSRSASVAILQGSHERSGDEGDLRRTVVGSWKLHTLGSIGFGSFW